MNRLSYHPIENSLLIAEELLTHIESGELSIRKPTPAIVKYTPNEFWIKTQYYNAHIFQTDNSLVLTVENKTNKPIAIAVLADKMFYCDCNAVAQTQIEQIFIETKRILK